MSSPKPDTLEKLHYLNAKSAIAQINKPEYLAQLQMLLDAKKSKSKIDTISLTQKEPPKNDGC